MTVQRSHGPPWITIGEARDRARNDGGCGEVMREMDVEDVGTIGQRVRFIRHAKGKSLAAVARLVGITRLSCTGWSPGSAPRIG